MARNRKRRGRPISGILLLNKPGGITSNRALQNIKWLYKAAKAGHTGSLDPLATGMLPICLGEATKFSQYLLDADKTYRVTGLLGVKTDSSDSEGQIIEQRPVTISEQDLIDSLDGFRGEIMQTPSMFSALKVDGQPLYKLAREGKTIERKARPVTIYKLDCIDTSFPYFSLEVTCSKGTYIRNLVEDIGEALGCGAHVTILERLSVGGFESDQMFDMDSLEAITDIEALDKLLLPVDTAVRKYPKLTLSEDSAYYIQHGQTVQPDFDLESATDIDQEALDNQLYRLFDQNEQFIGLGHINEDGMLAPKRLVAQE